MARVRFFASCLVEILRPDVGAAARRVLAGAGYEPLPVSGATCCGQPAYNAGYAAEARRVAKRTLKALERADRADNAGRAGRSPGGSSGAGQAGGAEESAVAVVVASGSCATMMSHHWPALFEGTPQADAARRAAARTVELTALLAAGETGGSGDAEPDATDEITAQLLAAGEIGGSGNDGTAGPNPVVVHDSCHALRELGAGVTVRRALRGAGLDPVSADGGERCCGFGGSFSVKMPDVSVAMADDKLDNFALTGCEQVTSCDLSCLLHLQGRARRRGLPLRFEHVALVLDRHRQPAP